MADAFDYVGGAIGVAIDSSVSTPIELALRAQIEAQFTAQRGPRQASFDIPVPVAGTDEPVRIWYESAECLRNGPPTPARCQQVADLLFDRVFQRAIDNLVARGKTLPAQRYLFWHTYPRLSSSGNATKIIVRCVIPGMPLPGPRDDLGRVQVGQ